MICRTAVARHLLKAEGAKLLLRLHDSSPESLKKPDIRQRREDKKEYPQEGNLICIRKASFKEKCERSGHRHEEGHGYQDCGLDDQAGLRVFTMSAEKCRKLENTP